LDGFSGFHPEKDLRPSRAGPNGHGTTSPTSKSTSRLVRNDHAPVEDTSHRNLQKPLDVVVVISLSVDLPISLGAREVEGEEPDPNTVGQLRKPRDRISAPATRFGSRVTESQHCRPVPEAA
jgi:hypothetical protein